MKSLLMEATPRHNSDGMALIMVMCAIFVLSALAAGFALSMKVETKLAQNANSEQQLLWLGRSGVEFACYILSQHPPGEPWDSLNQKWAGGSGSLAESNSVLSSISLDNYPVGDGTVSIKIIDLERKVNINTAVNSANSQLIQQALILMGVDASEINVVSDSIKDWIRTDGPQPAGAKSDYYQGLAVPYYAKEAPIDDLSELLLVKGILDHPEIYWGGSATNHEPAQFQHKLGFGTAPGQIPDYPFGLKDIFTPFSTGKININTADANVLQMIPGVDAAMAEAIIKQRAGPDGADGTEDDMPFRGPGDLARTGLSGPALQQASQLCTTSSSTFEVHVTAQLGDYKREFIAILARTSGTVIQVLSFYWK
jgi:type II secretory pathway component PulK